MKIGDFGECQLLPEAQNYISVAGTPGFMDAVILEKGAVSVLSDSFVGSFFHYIYRYII